MSSLTPPNPNSPEASSLTFPRRPGELSIMVIDDSLAVRKVIEASFHRVGLAATGFPDGLSAIQALVKGEVAVPDLLLLDIGLPKMDGYEVARILRTKPEFEQTIIIMLTGRDGVLDRIRSKMVGAHDFIKKPFRVSEVVNAVCAHLQVALPNLSTQSPTRNRGGTSRPEPR